MLAELQRGSHSMGQTGNATKSKSAKKKSKSGKKKPPQLPVEEQKQVQEVVKSQPKKEDKTPAPAKIPALEKENHNNMPQPAKPEKIVDAPEKKTPEEPLGIEPEKKEENVSGRE